MGKKIKGGDAELTDILTPSVTNGDPSASDLTGPGTSELSDDEGYRAFIQTSAEGIWRCEMDEPLSIDRPIEEQIDLAFKHGFLAECNDAFANQYGYENASEIIGTRLSQLLIPEDPNNRGYVRAFIESGYRLSNAESHELDRHGNDRYFRNSLVGIVKNGKLLRAWGTQVDITEERQAEEMVRISESQMRHVIDAMPALIAYIDRDYRYTFVNHAYSEWFGAVAEDAVGRPVVDVLGESAFQTIKPYLDTALSGKVADFETEIEYREGGNRYIHATYTPDLHDDGVHGIFVMVLDHSASRRAELELRESQMLQAMAMESSRMGLWENDLRSGVVHWSPELEEIFGLSPGAFPGTNEAFMGFVHEDDRENVEQAVAAAIEERRGYSMEFRYRHANGSIRWMEGRGQAVYSQSGEPVRLYGIGIDITERKHNEENLRQTQARLQSALEAGLAGTFYWNIANDRLTTDDNMIRYFGLSPRAKTEGVPLEEFIAGIHADDREEVRDALIAAASDGGVFQRVYRVSRPGSDERWLSVRGLVEVDAKGDAVFMSGFAVDITRLKQAEFEQQKSEARYKGLFDAMDQGFCVADVIFNSKGEPVDYRFLEINPAFRRHTGLANAEGKTARELLPALESHWFENYGKVAKTGEPIRFTEGSDAMGRWFDVYAYRIGGPGSTKVAILFTDITERKKAERAQARLASIVESSDDAIVSKDLNGIITSWNRGAQKIFGYTEEEAVGNSITMLIPPDLTDEEPAILGRIRKGQTVDHYETIRRRKDGVEIDISLTVSPIRDETGKVIGASKIGRDITQQKRSAENQRLLLAIGEKIRLADNAVELLGDIAAAAGKHLRLDRCLFDEIDIEGNRERISLDYSSDRTSLAGERSLEGFDAATIDELKAGRTVVRDGSGTRQHNIFTGDKNTSGMAAYVAVPLIRQGKWGASLWAASVLPRAWSPEEVGLLETVAERAWTAFEKIRIDTALRESEERFRNMADHAPVMIWVSDVEGAFTYLSQSWYECTGQTPETALGLGWLDAIHPEDEDHVRSVFDDSRRNKEHVTIEFRLRREDGEYIWVFASAQPRIDASGAFLGHIGSVIDITERKEAEKAMVLAERKGAEEYLHLLERIVPLGQTLGTAPDLLTIYRSLQEFICSSMDCSGFFVSFYDEKNHLRHPAFIWGEGKEIGIEELPPMPLEPGGGPNSQAVFEKRTVITNRFWDQQKQRPHIVVQEDGRSPMSSLVVPMMVQNRVIGTLEVQAIADEAFSREHAVALEMAANLAAVAIENVRLIETEARARHEAESANRMKDEFLSILSHELRTPLNAMLGWVRMLRAGILDEERSAKALEVIERNTRQQSSLIEDLLDVSRIISGKMRIEKEVVELTDILAGVAESIRPLAAAKDIVFEYKVPEGEWPLEGDAVRLNQLFTNLLQNSIKFTAAGGRVELAMKAEGDFANITVTDTGVGIDKDFLPHIFDRFSQADASTRRAYTGLGLGLTIVRNIAELHRGKVSAESEGENKGSRFTVTLPLQASKAREGAEASADGNGNSSVLAGRRVLVVDDDADGIGALQLFLEKSHARVHVAHSADDAVELLKSKHFDILISDIAMPRTDGYELIKQVRMLPDPDIANITAIALTAYASPADRAQALEAGYQVHLAKPLDFEVLLGAIGELMSKAENATR